MSESSNEVFISMAIIGSGDDERTAQSVLDTIFGKFDDADVQSETQTIVAGRSGNRADFSGRLSANIVSGNYVTIDLGEGVSFLAFGMGNVTQAYDKWTEYGQMDFERLLATVELQLPEPAD